LIEKTLIILKPDAVKRKLIGKIISRFEMKGLNIKELTMAKLDSYILEKHYEEHKNKAFFNDLIDFMTSGSVILIVLEGKNCIKTVRKMVGATDPFEADPGTIRGDFAHSLTENVIHASDSKNSADREIKLFKKYF
jgi:nucleoside-diphosphate kinase